MSLARYAYMSYAHKINPTYELCSNHDNGFIIDELCYADLTVTSDQ